ncbi:MAG: type II toxin-antitoxin system PemK/MazF family toxin [Actinomycetaceae bacterium]|nr:type II toxin-antitoxin system PemK/MazF family toxin [Actinomycetaceae bacterium]MDY6082514.1 type II toxin-antitoxin system PemK/MazF family toxin [Actinomycetaceae bacterium]
MHELRLALLDKTRPVIVLTREFALPALNTATIAPITSTIRGISSEVRLSPINGLDHDCVASLDNIQTIPQDRLGKHIGFLTDAQERALARAFALTFDLDVPIFS